MQQQQQALAWLLLLLDCLAPDYSMHTYCSQGPLGADKQFPVHPIPMLELY